MILLKDDPQSTTGNAQRFSVEVGTVRTIHDDASGIHGLETADATQSVVFPGRGESTLGNDARAAAQRNYIEVQFDNQPDENRFIRSDQASFVKYGIPALAFKFGWLPDSAEERAFNAFIKERYHRPSDDLKQPIDREAAVHFDRVLTTLAVRVGNAPSRPAWYSESFFSTLPRR